MVMHGRKEQVIVDGVTYTSLQASKDFSETINYIQSLQPVYVLVQGLVFPRQVIQLRKALGAAVKILVQHHGGISFRNPYKRYLQKKADACTDAYLFTARANADAWIKQGVIRDARKCFEVLEASTTFTMQEAQAGRERTGIAEGLSFLWVGRLDENKDPLCVLRAFVAYFEAGGQGRLYMIYQTEDLLPQVQALIQRTPALQQRVALVGKVPHEELEYWYSAADYYVSGSYYEGSGYALIEGMACGCVPLVTDIPSFRAIAGNCAPAHLYAPGDKEALYRVLKSLPASVAPATRQQVRDYFSRHLSFAAIADSIYNVCTRLHNNG